MNYRHAFHAGNFADLVKHAGLTLILEALTREGPPLTVVDSHAGAGAYDLEDEMARRTGEAAIARLAADGEAPEAFDMLLAALARANPGGGARIYPGSPALIAAALREGDRLIACELRPDDHTALAELFAPLGAQAKALRTDGFTAALAEAQRPGRLFVHIDPPFERPDDTARAAAAVCGVLAPKPQAVVAVWVPMKDLEGFDALLRRLEGLAAPVLVAECRLRPLDDPLRLNGCALIVANPPPGLNEEMAAICRWVAANLGDPGNEGRVWLL